MSASCAVDQWCLQIAFKALDLGTDVAPCDAHGCGGSKEVWVIDCGCEALEALPSTLAGKSGQQDGRRVRDVESAQRNLLLRGDSCDVPDA